MLEEVIRTSREQLTARNWKAAHQEAMSALIKLHNFKDYPIYYESLIYNILGDSEFELLNLSAARNHYEHSLRLLEAPTYRSSTHRADALNKLGNYWLEVKDFRQAVPFLEQALLIRRSQLGDDHLFVSDIYNNLGISYLYLGDFERALDFQKQALRIRLQHLRVPDPLLGQSYNNLGQCYQDSGDPEQAILVYRQALSNYQDYRDYTNQKADVLLNMGTVYADLDDLDQSIFYFQEALKLYEQSKSYPAIATCYNNLGNTWMRKDATTRAFDFYDKALQIRQALYGDVHSDVAESWYNVATTHYLIDQHDEAFLTFEKTLNALNFHPEEERRLDQVNAFPIFISSLYNLTHLYYAQYLDSDEISHLKSTLKIFEYADETLDYLRIRYEALGSKLNLVYTGHIVYEAAINVLAELQRKTGEAQYWHLAFKYAEKSKGLLLLDGLQKAKANAFSDVPPEVLDEMNRLEQSISTLEKEKYLVEQKGKQPTSVMLDSFDQTIFREKQEFAIRLQEINQHYPKYYELRYATTIPSIPKIQEELLRNDQTLVEYFIGSALYVFVINRDQFELITVPIEAEFDLLVDTFSNTIRQLPSLATAQLSDHFRTYTQVAHRLYQYLLAPAEILLKKHLIIVPDERLGYVSFDALLTQPVDSFHTFRNHPYLIRNHSISYNYSASLLAEVNQKKSGQYRRGYLGFAPEFAGSESEGLADLLFNTREIEKAHEHLGGTVFLKDEATKATFIKEQSKYNLIHLATHGKVNASGDDFSFLAFSRNGSVNQDDYLLYLREIYNLPIKAQLVILSACETGTGKLLQGEGIASIARGFSYAGAESLVATRWNVNDRTTSQLIGYFLENLKAQMDKDEAMQKAILTYIQQQNDHYAHPFYWSSFMTIGHMQPVAMDASYFLMVVASFGLILMAWLIFYFLKK